jgi:hypothetical protein
MGQPRPCWPIVSSFCGTAWRSLCRVYRSTAVAGAIVKSPGESDATGDERAEDVERLTEQQHEREPAAQHGTRAGPREEERADAGHARKESSSREPRRNLPYSTRVDAAHQPASAGAAADERSEADGQFKRDDDEGILAPGELADVAEDCHLYRARNQHAQSDRYRAAPSPPEGSAGNQAASTHAERDWQVPERR